MAKGSTTNVTKDSPGAASATAAAKVPSTETTKKAVAGDKIAEAKPVATPAAKTPATPAPAKTVASAATPAPKTATIAKAGTPAATLSAQKTASLSVPAAEALGSASRPPKIATGPSQAIPSNPSRTSTAAPTAPASGATTTTVTKITPRTTIISTSTSVTASTSTYGSSRYPWKNGIVTTVFWVGEPSGGHNFTPNYASSWDAAWSRSYGGYDNPDPDHRRNFIPVAFTPRQNNFYCALPYNDVTRGTTKPEARAVIPWFKDAYERDGQSVCRNRWVMIRSRSGRVAYAQWSDCGPFRTDHWQYVFGNERPKPNLNQGAGLDVSPAVRDYLGLQSTDVTDWKFVDAREVPRGPWALHGDNNTCMKEGPRMARNDGGKPGRVTGAELAVAR